MKLKNIIWSIGDDGSYFNPKDYDLPNEVEIPDDIDITDECEIDDFLLDEYGFSAEGYDLES